MADDCLVCAKQQGVRPPPGGAIYDDDLVYASHVYIPEGESVVYLGWLVVEPKRHAPGLPDLTDAEAERIGRVTTRVSRALLDVTGGEHVYSAVLGHHVPHLHIHLFPRYRNTPRTFWGLNVVEWPDAPRGGPGAVVELASLIRRRLLERD